MAIVQCPNNHYYDDRRNMICPYCEKLHEQPVPVNDLNEQLTSYVDYSVPDDDFQLTEGYGEAVEPYERTIALFTDETKNLLTVGWLVCMNNESRGKSYTVHAGRNFAGRAENMDLVLSGDDSISRENHFSVVYDPKSISFYLLPGTGRTYVNGKQVPSEVLLSDGDEIQVGQTRFLFIPFCREGREW